MTGPPGALECGGGVFCCGCVSGCAGCSFGAVLDRLCVVEDAVVVVVALVVVVVVLSLPVLSHATAKNATAVMLAAAIALRIILGLSDRWMRSVTGGRIRDPMRSWQEKRIALPSHSVRPMTADRPVRRTAVPIAASS